MLPKRFWDKVEFEPNSGCWIWVGARAKGYGKFWHDGEVRQAHRVAFEEAHGPIPAGLEPDHKCRVRACVNPGHIETVAPRVNNLRGVGQAALNAQKTHCPKGHLLDEANTYRRSSRIERRCRTC